MMGDVFDTFGEGTDAEQKLNGVGKLVAIMGGLAVFVCLTSYFQHSFLTKGGVLIARRIKTAYLQAILRQDSMWFDQCNYTELSSRVIAECKAIENGIGHKYGMLL